MKKSLLALAVLGAFAGAVQAQSSVTIYGIVDEGITYNSKVATGTGTSTGSQFQVNSGVIQGSRLGFKGTEDLGGGLSAIFALEAGFSADTGALSTSGTGGTSTLFRRKSIVGLAGGFGSVTVGRQTDYADTISAFTAVNDFGSIVGNIHGLDRLEGTRTNNSVAYTTTNLSGFTGNLMYGFGEQAGSTSTGQSFGLAGQYVNGPLGLGLNYYQSKAGSSVSTTSDTGLLSGSGLSYAGYTAGQTAEKVLNAVASYQFGPARVYGNYSLVKLPQNVASVTGLSSSTLVTSSTGLTLANAKKTSTFEIGTAYSLTAALKLLAAIDYSKATFDNVGNTGKLTQFSLGTDYSLSQRTDLYAFLSDVRAKNMNNPGTWSTSGSDANQASVSVGVRHKF